MTKIMLVEDDKSLREIYGIRLLAEGYEIKSAGDGEEALAMAIKEKPDLIISDVMMPKISGFDMLDILRATPETKDIKIIMMTALSSEDQRARGESLGANRYLVKSQVGIEDVVRTVHDVLADAPLAVATAAQMFGSPTTPTAVVNTPTPINIPVQPQPAPQFSKPEPEPTPAPISQPVVSQPTMMPQPTAPFSTAAPASLGNQMVNTQPQPVVAPTPIVNIPPQPTSLPPQPMTAPAPQPMSTPTPVTQPTSVPVTVTYAPTPVVTTPTPFQDVVQPSTTPIPDIAALIAQELNGPQTPQTPLQ